MNSHSSKKVKGIAIPEGIDKVSKKAILKKKSLRPKKKKKVPQISLITANKHDLTK
jgi:hypothetical protein